MWIVFQKNPAYLKNGLYLREHLFTKEHPRSQDCIRASDDLKMRLENPYYLRAQIKTEHVCHHSSFWGSRCDRNHPPTISLKLVHFHGDFGILFRLMAQVLSKHTLSLTSDHPFRAISTKLSTKSSHFG